MSPFFQCWVVVAIALLFFVFVGAPVGKRVKQWIEQKDDCLIDDITTGVLTIIVAVIAAAVLSMSFTAIMFGLISGMEQIVEWL